MKTLTEVLTEVLEAEIARIKAKVELKVSQAAYAEAMYWEEMADEAHQEEQYLNWKEPEPEPDRYSEFLKQCRDEEDGPYGWRTTGFRDGAMIW
jgi:hypothetical protein